MTSTRGNDQAAYAAWYEKYLSFEGHERVETAKALGLLQQAIAHRWPVAPRRDVVQRHRASNKPCSNSLYLQGLPTLFPAYAEALLVTALGEPTSKRSKHHYRRAYHALMCAKEGLVFEEAAGTLRSTRMAGVNWTLGRAEVGAFLRESADISHHLLTMSSLLFPPKEAHLWMRRYAFQSWRQASYVEKQWIGTTPVGAHLAAWADNLAVAQVLVDGGPTNGFRLLHEELEGNRDALERAMRTLDVPGPLYWDAERVEASNRVFLHWSIDQTLRSHHRYEAEVVLRFVAHNLVQAIKQTFHERRLPDFAAAKHAAGGICA